MADTPVREAIIKQISRHGPLSLADYMMTCLLHPKGGYYQNQPVFGAEGDFITAPEISQIFGEMIGLWLARQWHDMGQPKPFNLIELGPGRGTLMADIIRTTQSVPGFLEAADVHMVEASKQLRRIQKKALQPHSIKIQHHDDLKSIEADTPCLIIGNEFLDALPIHQYEKRAGIWLERKVAYTESDNQLIQVLSPADTHLYLTPETLRQQSREGDILEVCPSALSVMADISHLLLAAGGICLFIDYGYTRHRTGDSFQAMQDHTYVSPFAAPGLADLTAHVNFAALKDSGEEKGLSVFGPIEQGQWLMTVGAGARAMQLAAGKSETEQQAILSDLKRLTAPDEMGQLFKVMALSGRQQTAPLGF